MERLTLAHPPTLDCLRRDETWCLRTSILQASICPLREDRGKRGAESPAPPGTTGRRDPAGRRQREPPGHRDPAGLRLPSAPRSTTGPSARAGPQLPGPGRDASVGPGARQPAALLQASLLSGQKLGHTGRRSPPDPGLTHGPGRPPAGRPASEPAPAQAQTGPTEAGAGRSVVGPRDQGTALLGSGYRCGCPVNALGLVVTLGTPSARPGVRS